MSNRNGEKAPARILLLEDVDSDAELAERELRKANLLFVIRRVEREAEYRKSLSEFEPDLILADYNLPGFEGTSALRIAAAALPDIPFIFVSGTMGEERAVQALKDGATDYILKDRMSRLGPAVARALNDAESRRLQIETENSLKASEWKLREFIRASHEGLWEVDIPGERAWVSESYRAMLRYPAVGAFVSTAWWLERVHPDDAARIGKELADFLAGESDTILLAYRFRRGDGSFASIRDRILLIHDTEGKPSRLMGGIVDVSRETQAIQLQNLRSSVNRILMESLTIAEAMPRLVESVCSVLGWEVGLFWQVDPGASLLCCGAVWPADSSASQSFLEACQLHTLIRGEGLAGRVWQTRLPEVGDVDRDEPVLGGYARSAMMRQTCAFSVGTDRVSGVIQCFDRRIDALDRETLLSISEIGGHIGQFFDRREAELALERLFDVEHLIASISSQFVNLDSARIDEGITAVLRAVGMFLQADVSHLFQFSDDGASVSKTHEWIAQDIFHPMEEFQNLSVELFPTVGASLKSGAVQTIHDVSTLPDSAPEKQFFLAQGLHAVVVIPTIHAGTLIGFCGVATLSPRQWSDYETALLRVAGELIGNAVGRRKAERALCEQQRRLDDAEELAHIGHWERNLKTDRMVWSDQMYRLYGLEESFDPYPESVLALVHPDDRAVITAFRQDLERGVKIAEFRYRVRRTDGKYRVLEGRAQADFDRSGTLIRMFGTSRDITDEVHFIERIKALTGQYESIFESARDGIVATDRNDFVTNANRAALEMIGATLEKSRAQKRHGLIHHSRADGSPYPWEDCPMRKTLQDGATREVQDEVFWRSNGTPFPVEFTVTPLWHEGEISGCLEIFRDVTERKLIEGQLAQANSVASLGRLAATIAHEFNNVLMGIQPFAEVIRRAGGEPRVVKAGEQIIKSVRRGRSVTQDILRFTRPAPPALQTVQVDRWLDDLRAEMGGVVGQSVEVRIAADRNGLLLSCDPLQMLQVFSNLVLNARDAMPLGGVITIRVHSPSGNPSYPFGIVEEPSRRIHLSVSDSGNGIAPEALGHIFDPLFSTKSFGTGLGLAVVHRIVQQHGGQIFVESEVGKGTAFHLFLPLAERLEALGPEGKVESSTPRGRKILIVEDDALVAAGLAGLLELEDFTTEVAGRAEDALPAIRRFAPDAVLLDLHLSGKDGLEVYRDIEANWPLLSVIFSTGHGDASELREILLRPTVGFLLKPYEAGQMLAALEEVWRISPATPA